MRFLVEYPGGGGVFTRAGGGGLPGRGGVLDLPKNTNSNKAEYFTSSYQVMVILMFIRAAY